MGTTPMGTGNPHRGGGGNGGRDGCRHNDPDCRDGGGGGGGGLPVPNPGGGHPLPSPIPSPGGNGGSSGSGGGVGGGWQTLSMPNLNMGGGLSSYCGGGSNGLYNYFDCGANVAQDLALLIDIPFAGLEMLLIGVGCFAGPKGCIVGASLGQAAFVGSGANRHESALSNTSAALSVAADFTEDGHFGESTVVAVVGAVLGNLSKDPILDVAIDGFGSAYNHEINPIVGIPSLIGSFFSP